MSNHFFIIKIFNNNIAKVIIFSGAGISEESGISIFRDTNNNTKC